jgi:IPT/TIG domain
MTLVRGASARTPTVMALSLALTLGVVSVAGAAVVTVGSPLGPSAGSVSNASGQTVTLLPRVATFPGASVTSPVNGIILRWRVEGATGGPYALRVLQAGASPSYTAVRSGPVQPLDEATVTKVGGVQVQTFNAALPISAGQTPAVDLANGSGIIVRTSAGANYGFLLPALADGQSGPLTGSFPGNEIIFNVDVQPVPTVGALSPASGATTAGFPVVVAGTDLTGVKSVEFGGVPAQRFIPGTEGELTAFPPPVASPGTVPVTVTTIAGKSTNAGTFTYTACVVPKLTKKKLKVDRKALAAAGCTLGKVKRKKGAGKKAKVTKQTVKAGTVLPVGSTVGVTVG